MVYFAGSVLLLTILLWFPTSRLIWVISVRRLQKKTGAKLSQQQIDGQFARARFIAVFVSLIFSFLFNAQLLGIPTSG